MNVIDLLLRLNNLNIKLWLDEEGQLRYSAPKDALTPVLRTEIASHKEQILAFLRDTQGTQTLSEMQVDAITPASRDEPIPLSFAQEQLWLLDLLQPDNSAYNLITTLRLKGRLNKGVLSQALNEVIQRHESLRTVFKKVGAQPFQVIVSDLTIPLPHLNLQSLPSSERAAECERIIHEEAQKPFDLAQGPLVRARLLQVGETEHILLINLHHIVVDGWSLNILIQELFTLYESCLTGNPASLPPLLIQYADFAHWQRRFLSSQRMKTLLAYWQAQLKDIPAMLELPADRVRPPVQTFRGAQQQRQLSNEVVAGVNLLCRQEKATLFMVLLTAFKILLYRYTGQPDLVVGTPISGRNQSQVENLVGFFVNTLALRTDLSGNPSFRELLGRVRQVSLDAYEHQDLPFEHLLAALQLKRDLSHTPVFQVFFNKLERPYQEIKLSHLLIESLPAPEPGAKFDITLYVLEEAAAINLVLVYNADLFEAARMAEMLGQFHHLLTQIVQQPDQSIDAYSLVTPGAAHQLPDPTQPLDKTWRGAIHHLFSAQASRYPARTAVVDNQTKWTYQELEVGANQLARHLGAHGVVPGEIVAVYGHRSASLVWALMGILKAGAAFVILDPLYPVSRLAEYIELTTPRAWIQLEAAGPVPPALEQVVTHTCACQLILPPASGEHFQDYPITPPAVAVGPDTLAYVSFTSGSTGRPNGVLGKHGSLSYFIPWLQETFSFDETDRFSMLSGLAHDPLHRDIFTPLAVGAAVYVPDQAEMTPHRLAQWFKRHAITVAHLTPAMGQVFTSTSAAISLQALRYAFFVGDKLTMDDAAKLRRLAAEVTIINYYGATETQRAVGYYRVPQDNHLKETIPLGKGIPSVQLLVLNAARQLAGVGELGEIYVRSPHLAKGYLADPALTDTRFLTNPFTGLPDDRLYKTGDLGRYLPDGTVAFSGRVDRQMKPRGFRIEPGEIEAILNQHEQITNTFVTIREVSQGHKDLVAYVVPRQQSDLKTADLRSYLQTRLPDYMIPSFFIPLATVPLTPNGKVNEEALPLPDIHSQRQDHTAPRTEVEATLVHIWAEVMGLTSVGIHDNFFRLGGHSLLAVFIHERIRNMLQVELPLQAFFEKPTIAELAVEVARIQALQESETATSSHVPAIARGDKSLQDLLTQLDRLSEE